MKKTFISLISSLLLLTSVCLITVYALENDMPFIDTTKQCNLTIEVLDGTLPIEGFELSAYKVADIIVEPSHTVRYTPVAGLEGLVDYDGMSVEQSKTAAKTLEANTSSLSATVSYTDASGIAQFSDLEPGMYLIVNTKRTMTSLRYMTLSSFLVSVPLASKDDMNENIWEYDVKAIPKSVPKLIPDPPYYPPLTGVE